MKTYIRLLLVAGLFLFGKPASSQAFLSIIDIAGVPDTLVAGQQYFPKITVLNSGVTPYQGTIQIAMQNTNPTGSIDYLYFSNNTVIIIQGDTIQLTDSINGVMADSFFFRAGNNVVVVWPVTSQMVAIDSTNLNVFFKITSGLKDVGNSGLLLSPVPANEVLHIRSIHEFSIEHVRIFDVGGREIPVESHPVDDWGRTVFIGSLPPGTYILETIFHKQPPSRTRFIRD